MNNNLLTGNTSGKLIYGNEILLIIFAAFLLMAAITPKTVETNAAPVKVNLPTAEPITETLNSASLQITDDDQTTALLTIEELPVEKIVQ